MILEGLVTTCNADGSVNVAPMGPVVADPEISAFVLRPFNRSVTYQNLCRYRYGVLHITDDVEMLVKAAVGMLETPPLRPAPDIEGNIICDACRWMTFEVTAIDATEERVSMDCTPLQRGRQRDFFGFNRAKHAVLEAAILATRLHLIPYTQVQTQLQALESPVQKTAGEAERRAFAFVRQYIETHAEQNA